MACVDIDQLDFMAALTPKPVVTLEFVGAKQCKWPMGFEADGTMTVCGEPIYKHFSYCKNCCQRAFTNFERKK